VALKGTDYTHYTPARMAPNALRPDPTKDPPRAENVRETGRGVASCQNRPKRGLMLVES